MKLAIGLLCVCALVVWGLVRMDVPAPAYEDAWSKPGYSVVQTRAVLYESCGFIRERTPDEEAAIRRGEQEKMTQWMALFAASEQCMLQQGFTYTDNVNGRWGKCDQPQFRDFPSCRSVK